MSFLNKMKQQKLLSVTLLLFTLVIGIVIGTVINTNVRADRAMVAADATPLSVPNAVHMGNEFTKLAKKLEPSVVYIQSDYLPKPEKPRRGQPQEQQEDEDENSQDPSDLLKRFFGPFGNQMPRRRSEGSGTGFIVDKNGYIVTNYHVVDKADRVKVKMHGDDEEYSAKVIGFDPESDLAIIKVQAKKAFIPVTIGNSDSVDVGDWAVAIGSPFGLEATVTAGIVSATGRDLPMGQSFQHFIQTDAAINPGNSGGPLLNIRGEVIGVNTMIATSSGAYQGIGFAQPSNMVVRVYNDIIKNGRVVRGSIGIRWSKARNSNNVKNTLSAFGLDHGVIVEDAPADKPAGKAGIKEGDVILALNDRPVKDGDELVDKVADLPIGSTTLLTVDRNGKRMDFKVIVGDRTDIWQNEAQFSENRPTNPDTKGTTKAKFGIGFKAATAEDRQMFDVEGKLGVKVVDVDSGSFADDIGLLPNDLIISINRQDVTSPEDVQRIQTTLKAGSPVAIRIARVLGLPGRRGAGEPTKMWLSGRLPNE